MNTSKQRTDFVTNSSSVSYVCIISGETEGGSDCVGIEDYGFADCVNGHEFLDSYLLKDLYNLSKEDVLEFLNADIERGTHDLKKRPNSDYIKSWIEGCKKDIAKINETPDAEMDEVLEKIIYNNEYRNQCEVNSVACPICQMKYILDSHVQAYILKYGCEAGASIRQICDKIKDKYSSYYEMEEDLGEK
jgi:hypothetical protein